MPPVRLGFFFGSNLLKGQDSRSEFVVVEINLDSRSGLAYRLKDNS